jgi:hypothetical protein
VDDLYPGAPWVAEEHRAMDESLWKMPAARATKSRLPTRTGGSRSAIYHKATFTGPNGKVAGLMGTIIDVTAARKRSGAARERGALPPDLRTAASASRMST